jgi:2-aminoethylphosphonate-pyruvate transaminase
MKSIPRWKDKTLFTPGPLTTSRTVKQAMLRDLGSRDTEFTELIREIRRRLVDLAGGSSEFTTVLMQGSGTFGVEAVLTSVIPPQGKLLILINGAYGERMLKIAQIYRIPVTPLRFPENSIPDVLQLDAALSQDNSITHVAVVHCETTTGIINPIKQYGDIVRQHRRLYFVDAMSSFGAYPIDLEDSRIDYLVSSANKNIEGVPGFSFALARTQALRETEGFARTLSLDLLAQWQGLEGDGQFRFTPPTHVLLAFHQALLELEEEGGVIARGERYRRNYELTLQAMQRMGFQPYLPEEHRGHIITSFRYPDHPLFNFKEFYERLSAHEQVIYPGKLSHADCFRIGHVGRLDRADVQALLSAVAEVLIEMDLELAPVEAHYE